MSEPPSTWYTLLCVFLQFCEHIFANTFTGKELQWRHCFLRDPIGALSRLKFCQQLHATSRSIYKPKQRGFVCYLKPISYPFRPLHMRTGCWSKVGVACKNDTELMLKIRKLTVRNVTITTWRALHTCTVHCRSPYCTLKNKQYKKTRHTCTCTYSIHCTHVNVHELTCTS